MVLGAAPPARAHDEQGDPEPSQNEPGAATFQLGDWTITPHLELLLRGEARHRPVDGGGAFYRSRAVHADAPPGAPSPEVAGVGPAVDDAWWVRERARLGVGVAYGPARAVLTLQDARALGDQAGTLAGTAQPELPSTAPYEAYVELSTSDAPQLSFRLGRQVVVWGDGRLIGESDRSPTGRSLDAARLGVVVSDFEVEGMAVLLAAPGALPPEARGDATPNEEGTGAQLYGLRGAYHFLPWLSAEVVALSRIVRSPHPTTLTPGDTYVLDGRIFGDHRGLRYGVEGAAQLGRVASFGQNRDVAAFALAARAELETALAWHLTFGLQGAYASGGGEETDPSTTQKRFDPILPESHDNHGEMGLYAWSNLIEVGGLLRARPLDEVTAELGYAFVGLADPKGRWTTASLVPVGSDAANESSVIGHHGELDVRWLPWAPLGLGASYGILLLGEGGKNILEQAGRGRPSASHWGMLEAELRFP